mmetsp:Transcript_12962/g.29809  ORF Transcript_12962/g.29809 Transcript_12962/m.29809 type:complete len:208 (+) Transcript_12962:105-728(+)
MQICPRFLPPLPLPQARPLRQALSRLLALTTRLQLTPHPILLPESAFERVSFRGRQCQHRMVTLKLAVNMQNLPRGMWRRKGRALIRRSSLLLRRRREGTRPVERLKPAVHRRRTLQAMWGTWRVLATSQTWWDIMVSLSTTNFRQALLGLIARRMVCLLLSHLRLSTTFWNRAKRKELHGTLRSGQETSRTSMRQTVHFRTAGSGI